MSGAAAVLRTGSPWCFTLLLGASTGAVPFGAVEREPCRIPGQASAGALPDHGQNVDERHDQPDADLFGGRDAGRDQRWLSADPGEGWGVFGGVANVRMVIPPAGAP